MKAFKLTIFVMVTTLIAGCSNHWRETKTLLTAQDMQNILTEMDQASAQSQGTSNLSQALLLKDDPNVSYFFADAPSEIGQVPNIVGFTSYEFLGLDADFGFRNISAARVLFMDIDDTHQSSLIIGLKTTSDQFTYYAFTGSGGISGGVFKAELDGANGSHITLVSYDVSDSSLDSVIQLRVYDGNGNYIGKIATLVGFSN